MMQLNVITITHLIIEHTLDYLWVLLTNFARDTPFCQKGHTCTITNLCLFQREHEFIDLTDVEVEEAMLPRPSESLKDDKTLEGNCINCDAACV